MLFALIPVLFASAAWAAPGGVDFQRHVRPILSDNCFFCHGPDKNTRLVDLRLDTKDGAFSARKNGAVIVPGKPEASLLYQRLTHTNAAMRMPPAHSNKTVSNDQKQTIRKWIEQGAEWQEHWSFQTPKKAVPPAVRGKAWVRNPIDNFVLARLEAGGLQPAAAADRRALLRRVTLDLTGLPPQPQEVDAFVKDASPNAYEKVVDRLLASPRYGEHRGRYWLDAARYADTHGLHIDNYREIWPYRDWVIRAFNRNMPFDKFTVEQLAGDLLPGRTMEQQVASGFNRCNITTNEGGSIPDEVDAMYQKDRVETTATVWLGLTAGCATCHDHKFDPISQKEFYQMVAFFKNTMQKPLDGNIPDTPPVMFVPREVDAAKWLDLENQKKDFEATRRLRMAAASDAFEKWLASGEARRSDPLPGRSAAVALALNEAAGPVAARLEGKDLSLQATGFKRRKGPEGSEQALLFADKMSLEVPGIAEHDPAKPLTIATWAFVPNSTETMIVAANTDGKNQARGWVFDISGRQPRFTFAHPALPRRVQTRVPAANRLRQNAWTHLAVTYDGSKEHAGITLFVNGEPMPVETIPFDLEEESKVGDAAQVALRLGGDGRRYFPAGALTDFRIYSDVLSEDEMRLLAQWKTIQSGLADEKIAAAARNVLLAAYLNREDAEYKANKARLDAVEKQRREIRRRGGLSHVMQEKPDGKPMARILFRGMYDQPRDEVTPGILSVLPPMKSAMPRNRLGLAQWLVDAENPLMARVTVNRFWQETFGTGIVKTAEDFGSQGQPPTHPELLDWLAVTFRESGWDMKSFFRMMVTSSTYRQSAASTTEKLRKDPDNRLLSRGPRFRMDAEMVRDMALASSGVLSNAIGGPSVRPYQPEGIWETVAMKGSDTRFYKQDHGENLYRRSMYTFWKRSAPPASMEIFNAPSRENCTVRRERTNTPLQALVTMNDVQFVEAARQLAAAVLREPGPEFNKKLDALTSRVIARSLNELERKIVRGAYQSFLAHYQSNEADARKLLGYGESKSEAHLPAAEHAAWTMLANQILNLDEAINK